MSMTVTTNGRGYEEIRAPTGKTVLHHRLLAYAWGELESPFFERDPREVHHSSTKWDNREDTLEVLTPAEHILRDPGRARITTPWDKLNRVPEATD